MSFEDAVARFQRGDLAGAEALLQQLLAANPKDADALHVSAAIRHARGDLAGAADLFDRAFALTPDDFALAFNRAALFSALRRYRDCADAAAHVLRLRPGDPEALLMHGAALVALGEHAAALESLDAARLNRPDLHVYRAASLGALERYDEALVAAQRALALDGRNVDALVHRGSALLALDRAPEALASFEAALTFMPGNTAARAARATALADLGRLDEALADIDGARSHQPEKPEHLMRRAYILSAMNRNVEATATYEAVLAQRPDDAEALYGMAETLLVEGDFARGLPLYEARFRSRGARALPPCDAPLWSGEELNGKTLLLQGEQGFGDLFQFCRFAPVFAGRGARVVVQERPQTLALLQSLDGVAALASIRDPAPVADYRLPLASTMHALDITLETIPASEAYLRATPDRVARWRDRFPQTGKRRIGIAWSGVTTHATQRWRSLDDASLALLIDADADFVSLQMELHDALAARGVPQFGADIADFAALAALIETLDLVITIDTGVAHLAGALGKPVWIMLPFRADWRWLREREDTPWYPQALLFRQTRIGEWSGVIDRVHAALQE